MDMEWKRKRPEDCGVSPKAILETIRRCEKEIKYPHGLLITKDGYLLAEAFWKPERPEAKRNGYSLGKSMVSIAVGFAIEEGRLKLETKVLPYFQDEFPEEFDQRLMDLTVRDLLTMCASSATASTVFQDVPDDKWVTYYLSLPPFAAPGTEFHYDTGGMYLLSCLISKTTGHNTLEYLRLKLLDPLGIRDCCWLEDGKGRNVGGWGIYLNCYDGLKIAAVLANQGSWKGRQLIPAWFVKELAVSKVDTQDDPGLGWKYGYSFGFWKGAESVFVAFGAFGQLWICNPSNGMAVVTAAGCSHEDNKKLMEIVQQMLVLNAKEDCIPYEEEEYESLQREISLLSLPCPCGGQNTGLRVFDQKYKLEKNAEGYETVCFRQGEKDVLFLEWGIKGCRFSMRAGYQMWLTQESDLEPWPNHLHAFSYAWEAENVLVVMQYQLNQPSGRGYRFIFQEDAIQFTYCLQPKLSDGVSEVVSGRSSNEER